MCYDILNAFNKEQAMRNIAKVVWMLTLVLLFAMGIVTQSVSVAHVGQGHVQVADGGGTYGGGG